MLLKKSDIWAYIVSITLFSKVKQKYWLQPQQLDHAPLSKVVLEQFSKVCFSPIGPFPIILEQIQAVRSATKGNQWQPKKIMGCCMKIQILL